MCFHRDCPNEATAIATLNGTVVDPRAYATVPHRVLIIEDEISIRESLVDLFASDDVAVVAAATLADAKTALFSQLPLDLIITDLRLGGNRDGGLQVLAAAGLVHPNTPVIVLTAFPDDDNRHASERLNATVFLEKPVDLAVISRLARDHGVSSALSPSS